MNGWTEKEVKDLERMRDEGKTAGQIALKLSRSRSAICAKLMRLREARGETAQVRKSRVKAAPTVSATRSNPRSRATVRRSDKVAKPAPVADLPVEKPSPVKSRKIPFLKTQQFQCRWIDQDPGEDGLPTCCGHKVPATPGLMFCSYHRDRSKGDGTRSERKAISGLKHVLRKEAA